MPYIIGNNVKKEIFIKKKFKIVTTIWQGKIKQNSFFKIFYLNLPHKKTR